MLVFRKEKLVILANPKTGTTALEGALAPLASIVVREPADLKHAPLYKYQKHVLPFVQTADDSVMDTMALIRHPVDWLSSWFRYRCRNKLIGHPNSTRGVSFNEFVLEYCKDDPAPYARVGQQTHFLQGCDGTMGVTHVFRYEAPDRVLDFLHKRLGDFPALKRLNISPDFKVKVAPKVVETLKETHPAEFSAWENATH